MNIQSVFMNFIEGVFDKEQQCDISKIDPSQWEEYIHEYMAKNQVLFTEDEIDDVLHSAFIIVSASSKKNKQYYGCFLSDSEEGRLILDIVTLKHMNEKNFSMKSTHGVLQESSKSMTKPTCSM